MSFYEKLIALSFELYDINSNLSINISADTIEVSEGKKVIVSIWVQNGKLYPTIREHEYSSGNAVDMDTVLDILNTFNDFENE